MSLPTAFAALTAATGQELDNNFNALGVLTVLPCTVTGTNALTMSLLINTPTISVYSNYLVFSAISAASNTGAVTASVGGLPALSVFRDTPGGPVALLGSEIVIHNAFLLLYDSALSSGAGGFHLINPASSRYPTGLSETVSNAAGVTLTAAQLTGSGSGTAIIARTGAPGAPFSDTSDTATAILATLPGAIVGSLFRVTMSNQTAQVQTFLAGAGCTVTGTATTAAGVNHVYQGVVTNIGTPAVIFYG